MAEDLQKNANEWALETTVIALLTAVYKSDAALWRAVVKPLEEFIEETREDEDADTATKAKANAVSSLLASAEASSRKLIR